MNNTVIHKMRLLDDPYMRVKSGDKIIEIRLFDKKRQKLEIGDIIEFSRINDNGESKEKLKTEIIGLEKYNSFKHAVNNHEIKEFGFSKNYYKNKYIEYLDKIYSNHKDKQNGVLAISINLISKN